MGLECGKGQGRAERGRGRDSYSNSYLFGRKRGTL